MLKKQYTVKMYCTDLESVLLSRPADTQVLTSTPVQTPKKYLPTLTQAPVAQKRVGKYVCFICQSEQHSNLRKLCPNTALYESNPLIVILQDCLSIDMNPYKENAWALSICVTCKKKIEQTKLLQSKVRNALDCGGRVEHHSLDDSLGCSAIISTPTKSTRAKRMIPMGNTPTPVKRGMKKRRSDSKCSLSFSHNTCPNSSNDDKLEELSSSAPNINESVDNAEKVSFEKGNVISLSSSPEDEKIKDMNVVLTRLSSLNYTPGPSVLRKHSHPKALKEENLLDAASNELEESLPFLFKLLTHLCDPPGTVRPYTKYTVAMIYGMIMHNRNPLLSAIQKLNTAAAIRLHANNELLDILHKVGVTMSVGYKLAFLDSLGRFNTDTLIHSLRKGDTGKLTIDNIDGMILARQVRKGDGNRHFHFTASTYYPDRCNASDLAGLSMCKPSVAEMVDPLVFFLTPDEEKVLMQNYGYQIGRLLVRFCPELKWMDKCIPKHIEHDYSAIMARKSEVIPLKIILEDPKYYTGCIRVLEELTEVLRDSYEKAGRSDDFDHIIVPLGGDQLVRVRATGSRDLRAGGHTRSSRLETIYPELIEFFHVQQDFLEKMCKAMYKSNSSRDVGSIEYFRVVLERTNANGQVKGKYQAHEDLVTTVGSGILLKLAMDKMRMSSLYEKPEIVGLPENIARMHVPGRKVVFNQMMQQIIQEIYCSFNPLQEERPLAYRVHMPGIGQIRVIVPASQIEHLEQVNVPISVKGGVHTVQFNFQGAPQDDLRNYSTQYLQWFIHMLEFEDAIREGDIVRCNIALKMMIPFFYGHSCRSKYAVECIDYILKTEVLLPQAVSLRCRLGSFVNSKGGEGKNKPTDMQQENNILVLKDVIKGLGAGKTDKSLVRISLAAPVCNDILQNYREMVNSEERAGRHVKKSVDDDVKEVVDVLNQIEPFAFTPGRTLTHYPGIKANAFSKINKAHFMEHLACIVNRLKRGQNIDLDFYNV